MEQQEQTPVETPEESAKKQEEQKSRTAIAVRHGLIMPTDTRELYSMLANYAAGGSFPDCFDKPQQRLAAYNLARSLMGDLWQLAVNNMAPIKGKLTIYGELPGTLAERTGDVQERQTYVINSKYEKICIDNKNLGDEVYAAICVIQRRGRVKKEFFYTRDEALRAGQIPAMKWDKLARQLVPNPDSPWEKHFKVMLMRKAQGMAIKFEFPDALVGVPIAEYDFDEAPDLKDVSPSPTKEGIADELNKTYLAPETDQGQESAPANPI